MPLTHERCIDLAVSEIRRLADVADGVETTAPVPTCGDWTVADLLQHVGEVNRWAASMVAQSSQERVRRDSIDWGRPAADEDLPAWVAAGAAVVRDSFLGCDPATPMWAWGVPKSAAFWPRRMVHETGVHRADAQLTIGEVPTFDATVAADGIDELLDNIPEAAYFAAGVRELTGDGEILGLVATDLADVGWHIELLPEGFTWIRTPGEPTGTDALVAMSAGDLLLAMYGRIPATVDGSQELWDHWQQHSAL